MTLLRTILLAWTPGLIVFACLFGASWLSAHGQAPHRFGFGNDGNFHDVDDKFAAAVIGHIVQNSGQGHRLTHWEFNNHFPETRSTWERHMRDSTIFSPYAHFAMVDCRAANGRRAAVDSLRSQIVASHSGNTFYYALCGPPDILYDATRGVPAHVLKHVYVVDHSSLYNSTTGGQRKLSQISGVRKIAIPNGNSKLNTKKNGGPWQWMTAYDKSRAKVAGRWDCSDSTTAGYIVHGVRQTTIAHLKGWIGQ